MKLLKARDSDKVHLCFFPSLSKFYHKELNDGVHQHHVRFPVGCDEMRLKIVERSDFDNRTLLELYINFAAREVFVSILVIFHSFFYFKFLDSGQIYSDFRHYQWN